MTYGETISIDDFFTEQTYQYVATYMTPWIPTPDATTRNEFLGTLNFIPISEDIQI
jgi:hypothetical protein